ncbi:MAG: hypothetical protein IJX97_02650 [Clostridia bacterium]|nr:hypothetical protein [Clostridia bacterium]
MKYKRIKKYGLFFLLGAVGYGAIETIWRGYTHWSMMIAGGICFIIFSLVAERFQGGSIFMKAAICAFGVTAVEFIFGVIFNIWLGMGVWDYSHLPYNLLGQICPMFTLLWAGIAIAFLPFAEVLNRDYA